MVHLISRPMDGWNILQSGWGGLVKGVCANYSSEWMSQITIGFVE